MIEHHTTRPLYLSKPISESSNKTKKNNTKRVQNENKKNANLDQNNLLTKVKIINRLTAVKLIQKANNS